MSGIPWTWFVMRSSGLVAVGLLTVSVVLGLVGPRLRPAPRLTSISVHRHASTAGIVLIGLHVVLALIDRWITLDWPAALLPGVAGWHRWGVALGALAVDLLIVLAVTTATRVRAPRTWRRAHLVAYPVWALAVGHGLLVGTDTRAMRVLALVSVGLVLAGVAVRLVVPARTVRAPGVARAASTGSDAGLLTGSPR